jgi:hypothetical protein
VVEAFMNTRTPIVLFIIAAILLAYALLFERGRPGRTEIDSRSGLLLETLFRERITRIRIAAGEDRIVLRREGEGFDETWTLEEPNPGAANPDAIEDYLRNWEFAIPVRTLQSPSAEDIESFGIDRPKAEITFEMASAKTRVVLGSGTPVDGGGYVLIDEGPQVTVVGEDVVALFARTADSFMLHGDAGAPYLSDLVGSEIDAGDASP